MNTLQAEVKNCHKCGEREKLSCKLMKEGNCRIIVIGESPAKDGWVVSGEAFYNTDGKLQASGKVLDKLLRLCGLSIDDIYFTEACKCIISDRNRLSECANNCKPILFKQLEECDCDIILTMGQCPTEVILGERVKKLKDFVGRKYSVKFGEKIKTVVPIFHTSPISPLSFKGNEPIFRDIISKLVKE